METTILIMFKKYWTSY